MQEKKSVDIFFRRRDFFYESLSIALLFTIFLILVFSKEVSSFHKKLNEKKLDNDVERIERFLVRLEKVEDSLEKSRIVSDNSQRGSGRIRKSEEQHVVGDTKLSAANSLVKSLNLKYLSLKNSVDKSKISPNGRRTISGRRGTADKKTPLALSKDQLGIITKNKTEMHFWIDENNQLRVSVERSNDAAFFLELSQQVINRFILYFNSQRALNHLLLERDSVSTLVKIDRKGNVTMVGVTSKSQYQPYLDYIASRAVSNLNPLKNSLSQNGEDVYVTISFHYTGPPLHRWKARFEVVEN